MILDLIRDPQSRSIISRERIEMVQSWLEMNDIPHEIATMIVVEPEVYELAVIRFHSGHDLADFTIDWSDE